MSRDSRVTTILIGTLLVACSYVLPARGEVIHLRNGGTITGRILERTRDAYRVELSPGAVISLATSEVRKIDNLMLADEVPSLDIKLEDVLPKSTPRALHLISDITYESRLENLKTLDELIADGSGVPQLEHNFQVEQARQRDLAEIRFMGQTFYLDEHGVYSPRKPRANAPRSGAAPGVIDPFSLLAHPPVAPSPDDESAPESP